jgi:hypothetical protein
MDLYEIQDIIETEEEQSDIANILMEFVEHPGFKLFFKNLLRDKIEEFKNSILQIHPEANKVQYSWHDIDRKVLHILQDLYANPANRYEELRPFGIDEREQFQVMKAREKKKKANLRK